GRVQYAQPIFAVAHVEVWLVNAIDQERVASDAQRVKHVRELVIRVELAIGDRQRQIEGAGGQRRRIGWIINNVHTGQTPPPVTTGNIHAVVVVKMHRA